MKETNIQRLIMLATSEEGATMFRNNCGTYKTEEGHYVKYGVGNPGGSDLIGITPMKITQDMVGETIGVFTAIEVKTKTGRARKDQINFIDVIKNNGGIAGIARSPEQAIALLRDRTKK